MAESSQRHITTFPNKRMSEKDKSNNKDYHVSWCKAIYHLWKENKTAISEQDRDRFKLLRLYSSGNQPQSLYQDSKLKAEVIGDTQYDSDGEVINKTRSVRAGYNNVSNENVSLMPRIKNRIKGYLNKIDYDITIDTIDDNSGAEKESKKNAMRLQMDYGKFIAEFKRNAGIPVEEPMYVPQTPQELELFESVQGFKLNNATAMEKVLKHSFEISNWNNFIYDLAQDDICDLGWVAGRVYFDCEDFKFKVKYCDPEFVIVLLVLRE